MQNNPFPTPTQSSAMRLDRGRTHSASHLLRHLALAASLGLVQVPLAQAQSHVPVCPADSACWSSKELAVFVRSVSSTSSGGWKHVNVSLRFFNRSAQATALAYVGRELVISDNRSHRSDNHGRTGGMPRFEKGQTQTNFRVEPGEHRDATIEFNVWTGQQELGDLFEVSLLVRELRQIGDTNRVEGGIEHAIVIPRLREGTYAIGSGGGAAAVSAPVPGATASPAPLPPAAQAAAPVDPCKGVPLCAVDGPLRVEVVRIGSSTLMNEGQFTDPQLAVVNLKFKNLSDAPLQLTHKLGDSHLSDSGGNKYGEVAPPDPSKDGFLPFTMKDGSVSSDLVLGPGATRSASLIHILERASKLNLKDRFNYEIDLAEYNPQERKVTRDFTVKFNGVNGKLEITKRKSGFEKFKDQQAEDFEKFKNQ